MFNEYPKWVSPEGCDPVLVESAPAEAEVMGQVKPDAVLKTPHAVSEPPKRGPGRPRKSVN